MKSLTLKTNCIVKGCKNQYGGWIDVCWKHKDEGRNARMPFCSKHFKQIYPELKKIEKTECKKNEHWAFAPLEVVNQILAKK